MEAGQEKLELSGPVTIQQAQALKDALLQALELGDEVCVDLSNATEVDLSALQILWSARRSAECGGKRLRLSGTSGIFSDLLTQAGFDCTGVVEKGAPS